METIFLVGSVFQMDSCPKCKQIMLAKPLIAAIITILLTALVTKCTACAFGAFLILALWAIVLRNCVKIRLVYSRYVVCKGLGYPMGFQERLAAFLVRFC